MPLVSAELRNGEHEQRLRGTVWKQAGVGWSPSCPIESNRSKKTYFRHLEEQDFLQKEFLSATGHRWEGKLCISGEIR